MNIGRYCSIGRAFIVMGGNHPMDFVTTSSCIYDFGLPNSVACLSDFPASPNKYPYFKRYNRDGSINIGNDVWIGEEVKIKRGVNISTGTVVAANSIVTKDVAPYTVVGGIPARPIKQRFSDEVISDLLDSKWWEYDYSQICTLSLDSPKIFLEELKYRVISGLKPNRNINPLTQDDLKKITSQK